MSMLLTERWASLQQAWRMASCRSGIQPRLLPAKARRPSILFYCAISQAECFDLCRALIWKNQQHNGPVRGLDFNAAQPHVLATGATNGEVSRRSHISFHHRSDCSCAFLTDLDLGLDHTRETLLARHAFPQFRRHHFPSLEQPSPTHPSHRLLQWLHGRLGFEEQARSVRFECCRCEWHACESGWRGTGLDGGWTGWKEGH